MTQRIIVSLAAATFALAACSSSDEPADDTTEGTAADPGQQTCVDFYEGTGTPPAERAEAARDDLTGGAITDPATYGEVSMLQLRLADLAEDAPEDLAALLERVNAPFDETVAQVNEARSQAAEDEAEVDYSGLTDIDVADSAAAQDEIATACEAAGYEIGSGDSEE